MNGNLDQKEESVIEEALKLKDEGKCLSYIIGKFPDHKSEIREVFGTVAFIKEKEGKIIAPKNILKTLLSKVPDNSPTQSTTILKKETARENAVYAPFEEDEESESGRRGDFLTASEDDTVFSKWKVIVPVMILAVVMGIILLRSDSRTKDKAINEENQSSQNSDALNSVPNGDDISSSTKKDNN